MREMRERRAPSVLVLLAVLTMLLALLPVVASAQDGVECAEEVVVQKDDWLSKYADKYLGNVLSWPAIMAWNNEAAAAEPDKYDKIENPDFIVVGWSIWKGIEALIDMKSTALVPILASKPRPRTVSAKVPWTSLQARTQREQTMHLEGSKSK